MPEAVRPEELHHRVLGESGPRVVLVHGLVMDNLSSWYFTVATALAASNEVLLYDLRGHGRSPRTLGGHGLQDQVGDLLGLLDLLGWSEPVHLVGNSFGGLIALATALLHPGRVASVVLVDGLVPEPGWGGRMAETLQLQGEARDRKLAEGFSRWAGRHSDRKRNRLAEQAGWLTSETALLPTLRDEPGWPAEVLAGLQIPVLGLYGADSDVLEPGRRLVEALPRGALRIWPGVGHTLLWDRTDEVRQALLDWLDARREAP
jgi:pimeloyl-ACP methyl ester carboxylesterase